VAFAVAGLMINASTWDFQASVLAGKKSAPFDGTVAPIKKVPNWVALSSSEWKAAYDQIPLDKFIDFPEYTPSQLIVPFSTLNLSKAADKVIRNAQVTFSTPYMGNYKLDGQEYAGSHLAVDIKIPSGTPVYAIANGVVVKALNQSSGFGYHVVLRHDEVPSINNADVKTTYYSGYAHLSNYVVAEGDLVSKGQLIGSSGSSGTATTPHLHFQIDNDQAPWHMYWPFTSKDAADAGVNFWDGVSAGLGREKALATTINPLVYVQKYKNSGNTSAESALPVTPAAVVTVPVIATPPVVTTVTSTPAEPAAIVAQPTVNAKPAAVELAGFKFKHSETFTVGNSVSVQVIALDKDGKVIADFSPNGEFSLKLENGGGTLSKSYLSSVDFHDGVAEFSIMPTVDFGTQPAENKIPANNTK
jgi:murein DD-endopeptidase MepM/ murein hydrolase activator NlpD